MRTLGTILALLTVAGCGDDSGGGGSDGGTADGGGGGGDGTRGDSPIGPTGEVLHVDGRFLLDTCGQRVVIRGVEQVFGIGIDVGGSWPAMVDEIATTGANAVRVLPNLEQLDVAMVDTILTAITGHDMIIFISPGDRTWFGREDVRTMLGRHEAWLIVDAFQEPDYDDRARWRTEALAAVAEVRGYGYRVPITVLGNQYGRDLPSVLMTGAEIAAADPAGNTILGWQSYWGSSMFYQGEYGMSLTEGIQMAAQQAFPIQSGILNVTDGASETMDYASVMAAAEAGEIGWLWWDWYNPFDFMNNQLTEDGTFAGMNALGTEVVTSDANGIDATARKACRP
jgi:mannan endo-1,4-beta-mannosidase